MTKDSANKGLKASFKSMDTEEFLDIYFNRPIGYVWALFFQRLNIHPNVVTILSIILGIAAGMYEYETALLNYVFSYKNQAAVSYIPSTFLNILYLFRCQYTFYLDQLQQLLLFRFLKKGQELYRSL